MNLIHKHSPFLQYLPFLLLYITLVLVLHEDSFSGDEGRYYQFAENLIKGFYSPSSPDFNLWNGPGYPIFLMPFVYFGLPLLSITLFNALFQYLSIVFLHQSLRRYLSTKTSSFIAFLWGCYYISFQELGGILTESFSLFLISLFLYFFVRANQEGGWKWSCGSGMVLGYLALTKIIFGYVTLVMLWIAGLQYLLRNRLKLQQTMAQNRLWIFTIAFLFNAPYLIYTHSLTGKYFYWGNSGGMSLYWMSTPFEGEYGDWNNPTFTANCHDARIPCNADLLAKNHQADMDCILSFPKIEQDDAYKSLALQNIRNHPTKYLRNVVSNVNRLFFGMPISYYPQRDTTMFRFPPNILLLSVLFLATVVWLLNFWSVPIEVTYIALMGFVYLGGTSLLSAYPRMLYMVVPMLLFWCGYVLSRTLRVSLKWGERNDLTF
ncbi:MAG: ArnT family glycosyltransferase [Chitinophagales bacterium]